MTNKAVILNNGWFPEYVHVQSNGNIEAFEIKDEDIVVTPRKLVRDMTKEEIRDIILGNARKC